MIVAGGLTEWHVLKGQAKETGDTKRVHRCVYLLKVASESFGSNVNAERHLHGRFR